MGLIDQLTQFTANTTARASEVAAWFAEIRSKFNTYAVLTDTAKTITASHTFSGAQTFSGGVTASGTTTHSGTLNVSGSLTKSGAAGAGKFLRGDGTSFVASTMTLPDTVGTEGQVLAIVSSVPAWSSLASATARVYMTTDQALATDTPEAVVWDAETFDTATFHDNASDNTRLTAPTTGKYLVHAQLRFNDYSGTGDPNYFASIRKNGTTVLAEGSNFAPDSAVTGSVEVMTIVDLAATDYVEILAEFSGSGGSTADVASTENVSWADIMRIV